ARNSRRRGYGDQVQERRQTHQIKEETSRSGGHGAWKGAITQRLWMKVLGHHGRYEEGHKPASLNRENQPRVQLAAAPAPGPGQPGGGDQGKGGDQQVAIAGRD